MGLSLIIIVYQINNHLILYQDYVFSSHLINLALFKLFTKFVDTYSANK
jgi:hypothetical protein